MLVWDVSVKELVLSLHIPYTVCVVRENLIVFAFLCRWQNFFTQTWRNIVSFAWIPWMCVACICDMPNSIYINSRRMHGTHDTQDAKRNGRFNGTIDETESFFCFSLWIIFQLAAHTHTRTHIYASPQSIFARQTKRTMPQNRTGKKIKLP